MASCRLCVHVLCWVSGGGGGGGGDGGGGGGGRFSNDPGDLGAHAWPALAAVMVAVSCDEHSCLHPPPRGKNTAPQRE